MQPTDSLSLPPFLPLSPSLYIYTSIVDERIRLRGDNEFIFQRLKGLLRYQSTPKKGKQFSTLDSTIQIIESR